MDYKRELKNFTAKFKKYRDKQNQLVKMKKAAAAGPDTKNTVPMLSHLVDIKAIVDDMDADYLRIAAALKAAKKMPAAPEKANNKLVTKI